MKTYTRIATAAFAATALALTACDNGVEETFDDVGDSVEDTTDDLGDDDADDVDADDDAA